MIPVQFKIGDRVRRKTGLPDIFRFQGELGVITHLNLRAGDGGSARVQFDSGWTHGCYLYTLTKPCEKERIKR